MKDTYARFARFGRFSGIFTEDKIYSVPTITTAVEGNLSSMLNQAKKTYLNVQSTGKICAV